ncbi:MAG: hypothetical protein JXB49_08950 [Bacteroidales bacterium]|nr:hypothetical protein [Bacteroidales bacterium]
MDKNYLQKVLRIESKLPAFLPEKYKEFLCGNKNKDCSFLHPSNENWESMVSKFLNEWHPLANHLFPIEYLGEGIFACLNLINNDLEHRVHSWDISMDLAEQSFIKLSDNWLEYKEKRENGEFNPLEYVLIKSKQKQLVSKNIFRKSLNNFNAMQNYFHSHYQSNNQENLFEHHAINANLKITDWKPERFAVQDILLGVMAYRFNAIENTIDVIGFTTRDHTNFARGSATAALMVGLLSELTSKNAESIRFIKEPIDNINYQIRNTDLLIPYEIILMCRIYGNSTIPTMSFINREMAEKLYIELSPFTKDVRKQLQSSNKSVLYACLNVNRQIWSSIEIALLFEWCPDVQLIMKGDIDIGESLRFFSLISHARAAALVGYGLKLINSKAEIEEDINPSYVLLNSDFIFAYSVYVSAPFSTEWQIINGPDCGFLTIEGNKKIIFVGISDIENNEDIIKWAEEFKKEINKLYSDIVIIGIIPDKTISMDTNFPINLICSDEDSLSLDLSIHKRLLKSRRIHE